MPNRKSRPLSLIFAYIVSISGRRSISTSSEVVSDIYKVPMHRNTVREYSS